MKNKIYTLFIILIFPLLSLAQVKINMEKDDGVYVVPCKVNGLPLKFIFDTGASDVVISYSEAIFMLKNGYLKAEDIKGTSYSQIANGDIVENTKIILREIEIGGMKIYNISGSISHSLEAPLLLGQSALQKLGTVQVKGNELIIFNKEAEKIATNNIDYLRQKAYFAGISGEYTEALKYYEELKSIHGMDDIMYTNLGDCLFRLGDTNKAVSTWEECIALYPNTVGCRYNLGTALYECGEYERAERILIPLLDIRVKTDEELICIAYTNVYLGLISTFFREYTKAEKYYRNAIGLNSDNEFAYLSMADMFLEKKDIENAIKFYEKGIAYMPDAPKNFRRNFDLAIAYANKGNTEKTEEILSHLLKIMFECFDASADCRSYENMRLYTFANIYLARATAQNKNFEKCKAVCDFFLMINKKANDKEMETEILTTLCYSYENIFPSNMALDSINTLITRYPKCKDLLFLKAIFLSNLEREEDALQCYLELLKYEKTYNPHNFDYATVYNNIAWRYRLKGLYEEALPYAEKSISLNTKHSYSWETIGEIYYYLKRYNDCIKAMTNSINLKETADAYKYRGLSKIALGNNSDGNRDIDKSKQF